jgi:chitin disaccharide deacetylase
MKLLIVNADDFGMSPGVTAGIIDAHLQGIVTSTSLLVDTPFSEVAASAARKHPDLSFVLHACLTQESGISAIDFDDTDLCRAELRRQLDHFTALMGRAPTHLDSHHHVHREPRLRHLFIELAEDHSLSLREYSNIRYLSEFYGQWGQTTHPEQISVESLVAMIDNLKPGVSELSCHPGHVDDGLQSAYRQERETELATLCASEVRRRLVESNVELIGFSPAIGGGRR